MVTPIASRPAPLTQPQVDEFAGGRHAGLASVLHIARSTPPVSARSAPLGSSPMALSAKDMQSIAHGAAVPPKLAQRIAAASPSEAVEGKAKGKRAGKSKAGATTGPAPSTTTGKVASSKPSLKPQAPPAGD
jgi:hypothetical protein